MAFTVVCRLSDGSFCRLVGGLMGGIYGCLQTQRWELPQASGRIYAYGIYGCLLTSAVLL